MTLKEADEAAVKMLPVMYNGMEFARITRTGYRYDENGRHGFVELTDRYTGSVSYVDPERVTVKEGWEHELRQNTE